MYKFLLVIALIIPWRYPTKQAIWQVPIPSVLEKVTSSRQPERIIIEEKDVISKEMQNVYQVPTVNQADGSEGMEIGLIILMAWLLGK